MRQRQAEIDRSRPQLDQAPQGPQEPPSSDLQAREGNRWLLCALLGAPDPLSAQARATVALEAAGMSAPPRSNGEMQSALTDHSEGQPLPAPVAQRMSQRLGGEAGPAGVHAGSPAQRLALELQAEAVALGSQLFFAPSGAAPGYMAPS
jgi:hypothetical protein